MKQQYLEEVGGEEDMLLYTSWKLLVTNVSQQ